MKCQSCEKSAMYGIGPDGQVPVCLDCFIKFAQVMDRQLETLERLHNQVAAEFEMISGIPGIVPRYPPRPPRTVLRGGMTLNHIRVSNSSIGVLNTGTIGTIDGAVGVMKGGSAQEAAQGFKAITEAVVNAQDLAPENRNKVLELLSVVAAEGAAPKEKRRGEAMRILLRDVSAALSGSAALAKLWETLRPTIEGLF
jgi:hypothetical protein